MLSFEVWTDRDDPEKVLISAAYVVSVQLGERRSSYGGYVKFATIRTSDGREVVVRDDDRVVGKAIAAASANAQDD
jgi:hypothetical protein